jgi:hypothetical protein
MMHFARARQIRIQPGEVSQDNKNNNRDNSINGIKEQISSKVLIPGKLRKTSKSSLRNRGSSLESRQKR